MAARFIFRNVSAARMFPLGRAYGHVQTRVDGNTRIPEDVRRFVGKCPVLCDQRSRHVSFDFGIALQERLFEETGSSCRVWVICAPC